MKVQRTSRRKMAFLAGLAVLGSGAVVGLVQSPALAGSGATAAAECRTSRNNSVNPPYASGYCSGGPSSQYYAVVAECEENSGRTYRSYGNAAHSGATSYAYCSEGSSVVSASMLIS
ncbi:hypothetical protein [Actinoplanes sp. NPDC049265]|uniref:hypothetical protein n=1 Tax=Actinoplanes sp. NPDC049265 TaxID=3363902 RepID=UPI0037131A10